MNNKKSGKKKQFVLFGICSLLALALCMATLVVTVKNIESESSSSVNTQVNSESKTPLSGETNDLTKYIYDLTKQAENNKFIKVNSYTDVSVDDGSVIVTDKNGNSKDNDKNIFTYAKNYFIPLVDEVYGDDVTGVFGKNTGLKPLVEFSSVDNLTSAFSVGQVDENGENLLNDDGTVVDGDFYFITFEVDGNTVIDNKEKSTFCVEDLTEKTKEIKTEIDKYCEINGVNVTPESFSVNAKVNRFTDKIEYIEIKRNYMVSGEYNFIDSLSAFGKKNIVFNYSVTHRFEYFYAGVDISESEITLAEGKESAVTVNAVIEDYSDYTVRFFSSDESIATVDEMGYVKGVKTSEKPVTITVELEYLGETFTDECIVYVNDGKTSGEVAQ